MSELKLSEYIKSKKTGTVMKLAVAFILSFALLFVGITAVSSYSKTADVSTIVMTTDDGTYLNANKGGRVVMNGLKVGASKTQTLRQGQNITLSATAYEGYAFAGYYSYDTLISNDPIFKFNTNQFANVSARFAKIVKMELCFQNPDDLYGRELIYLNSYHIGQKVVITEELKKSGLVDESKLSLFENSKPIVKLDMPTPDGYVLDKNLIIVGSEKFCC